MTFHSLPNKKLKRILNLRVRPEFQEFGQARGDSGGITPRAPQSS